MFTTLAKTLKIVAVVAVAALSSACSNSGSYGVADYSYSGVSSGYSSNNVFNEF